MILTINELEDVTIRILTQIQADGGFPDADISNETRPLQDLEGFDSPNAVELIVELAAKLELDYDIPESVIISNKYHEYFSVSEIAKRLHTVISARK